jgi:GNAT superfamily N-acetyltransferase
MPLVVAHGAVLNEILDATFPLWHDGLTRDAYARFNAAQMRTVWGRAPLQRLALVDARGALLASAKRYRLRATLGGRSVKVCGIGAVFTPVECRGRGHASELIEQILAAERAEGAEAALLFSAIGPAFYERLGFTTVQLDEVALGVARKAGAPAMLVRAGTEGDLAALASMHERRSAAAGFALRRERPFIEYVLARKRLRAGLAARGVRQVEFHVAEEGASAVAYAVLSISGRDWTLDEAGDRDPAGARLGALLQVLLAREPSLGPPMIRAWWPRGFAVPPQVELLGRREPQDLLMMRALDDLTLPSTADEVFYWRGDVF